MINLNDQENEDEDSGDERESIKPRDNDDLYEESKANNPNTNETNNKKAAKIVVVKATDEVPEGKWKPNKLSKEQRNSWKDEEN